MKNLSDEAMLKLVLTMLFGSIIVSFMLLVGCANQSGIVVKIDTVGGDFWARKVGANNQMVDIGQTNLSANTTGVNGFPPIGLDWNSKMQSKMNRIEIRNVSGSIYFESAASDNQGVDISKVLEKVYLPGDPFKEN